MIATTAPLAVPIPDVTRVPTPDPVSYRGYAKTLRWMTLVLLVVGLLVRLERYALAFPVWGDEAFVTVNFLERDYLGLTKQLEAGQIVPILFLWAELAIKQTLGTSEWAMRLLPLLLGCASLWLMAYLARQVVSRLAAMLAIGILAIAIWPISMSCFVKSYSADLFFSLAMLSLATAWLRRPDALLRLAALAILTPLAIGTSYPAVFVGGAISIALVTTVWRQPGFAPKMWFAVYNLFLVSAFLAQFLLIGREQLNPETSNIHSYLLEYWADGFPPDSLSRWPLWLLDTQSGRIMAYPYGDSHGGSSITLIFCIIGSVVWWRTGRRALLMMMLLPFALNLLAAMLHKYPYGGCCRLSQHLAPASCLLMGTGIASVIEWWSKSLADRQWYARLWFALLVSCGLATAWYQAYRPYRDEDALWTRGIVRQLSTKIQDGDRVTVISSKKYGGSLLWWNLGIQKYPVDWDAKIDWEGLDRTGGRLWIYDLRNGTMTTPRPPPEIEVMLKPGWRIVGDVSWFMTPRDNNFNDCWRCDLYLAAPTDTPTEMPWFTQWPQP